MTLPEGKWRLLQLPEEIDERKRGKGGLTMMSTWAGFQSAWHIVPMMSDLDKEGKFMLPDVKEGEPPFLREVQSDYELYPAVTGKLMCLLLPFEFRPGVMLESLGLFRPSRLSVLGVGSELYFHQLFSLGFIFLFMGLAANEQLILNLTSPDFTSAEFSAANGAPATWSWDVWVEGWLIGSTVGTRQRKFDLRASGSTTLGSTIIFVVYLSFLRVFNSRRSRAIMETSLASGGDYAIEVHSHAWPA